METGRILRLLRILTLLQARKGLNARFLAQELEVSLRTIYRDMNVLELAGVPYHFDRESGGYEIGGEFFLPPVQLTLGEAISLSLLASQLARQRQIPFLEEAWRAMLKVESQLPASIRDELSVIDQGLFIQSAQSAPQLGCEDAFRLISRAIASRRKVRCNYDGGESGADGDGADCFFFRPYALFFCQRAWYAIGYSEKRGDERCLKLNRITDLAATDIPYMIPDGWSIESHLGNAWRMIRGEMRYQVLIRFDREFARTMADTRWHQTQKLTWQADGSCLFECEVDGLSEIVWWVLGYGPHAEVIRPDELRRAVLELAHATWDVYGQRRSTRNKRRRAVRDLAGGHAIRSS